MILQEMDLEENQNRIQNLIIYDDVPEKDDMIIIE
jgi:hypothetical protein